MFDGSIVPVATNGVATIGGHDLHPTGIGSVTWSWKDEAGQAHQKKLHNVLFFPDSLVNILSVTSLARQEDDEEGTWIQTKLRYSIFTWDKGLANCRINHSQNCLPELTINEGTSRFALFCKIFSASQDDTKLHAHTACMDASDVPFSVGSTARITSDGHNGLVTITRIIDADSPSRHYMVRLADGREISANPVVLRHPDNPDVASIPISPSDYAKEAEKLSPSDLDGLAHPPPLSPLKQLMLSWHSKLNHLSMKKMLRMSVCGFLPKKFLTISDDLPLCAS